MKNLIKNTITIYLLGILIIPSIAFADNDWFYVNSNRQIVGKDGLEAKIPFATKEECQKKLDEVQKGTSYDTSIIKCIQQTQKEVESSKQAEKENLLTDEAQKKSEEERSKKEVAILEAQKKEHDEKYTLLAPFSNKLTEVKDRTGLGGYLNQMFFIAIAIAGALAVVMIVVNGILYMGDESVFGKTKARERIMMAIGGLVLALGSWVLLRTINPDLVGGNLSIKQVSLDPSKPVDDPSLYDEKKGNNSGACASLKKDSGRFNTTAEKQKAETETQKRTDLVSLKNLGLNVKNNPNIQKDLAEKLVKFIDNSKINYSITEAFKATTYKHVSKCHYLASCVDLAFRKDNQTIKATTKQVRDAIIAFRSAGLFAQFEVGTTERYKELNITDLSENGCANVITVSGVAEHFSVYLK